MKFHSHLLLLLNIIPKPSHNQAPSSRQITSSKSHATTRNRGKEIVKPITPSFESASEEDRNDRNTGQFMNHRTVIIVGNKETVGNQLHDTDEELDGQELEANYMYMAKIQEVLSVTEDDTGPVFDSNPLENVQIDDEYNVFANEHEHTDQAENIYDTSLMEKVDSNTTLDSLDMSNNEFEDDKNAGEDERVMLANLIAKLKLDTDENKKIQKCRSSLHQRDIELEKYKVYKNCELEKEEKEMWRKSFVKYKPHIVKNIDFLPTQDSFSKSRHAFNLVQHNIDNFKTIVDIDWRKRQEDQWQKPITNEVTVLVKNLLIPLAAKIKLNANEFEIALKEEMFDDLQYIRSLEKEVDKLEFEMAEFSNEYDLVLQECLGKYILCVTYMSMLDSDNYYDMACKYLDKIKECERLEFELLKQNEFLKSKPTNLSNHSFEYENICLKKTIAQFQKDF
ncbi:hypothetical protein Tco_0941879 [Tanacetum coccineum]|uniref:Uncharacterized protein n=1 Tax=Tanacetum coccineum TaxID=301880 RepID=A0ABQ5DY37_9ASTR